MFICRTQRTRGGRAFLGTTTLGMWIASASCGPPSPSILQPRAAAEEPEQQEIKAGHAARLLLELEQQSATPGLLPLHRLFGAGVVEAVLHAALAAAHCRRGRQRPRIWSQRPKTDGAGAGVSERPERPGMERAYAKTKGAEGGEKAVRRNGCTACSTQRTEGITGERQGGVRGRKARRGRRARRQKYGERGRRKVERHTFARCATSSVKSIAKSAAVGPANHVSCACVSTGPKNAVVSKRWV